MGGDSLCFCYGSTWEGEVPKIFMGRKCQNFALRNYWTTPNPLSKALSILFNRNLKYGIFHKLYGKLQ